MCLGSLVESFLIPLTLQQLSLFESVVLNSSSSGPSFTLIMINHLLQFTHKFLCESLILCQSSAALLLDNMLQLGEPVKELLGFLEGVKPFIELSSVMGSHHQDCFILEVDL